MEVKDYARNTRQSGFFGCFYHITRCFPGGAVVKNPPANAGDARDGASIPGLGRSPGEGNGNPLLYSYLGNLTAKGIPLSLWTTVYRVTESWTRLSTTTKTTSQDQIVYIQILN